MEKQNAVAEHGTEAIYNEDSEVLIAWNKISLGKPETVLVLHLQKRCICAGTNKEEGFFGDQVDRKPIQWEERRRACFLWPSKNKDVLVFINTLGR